MHVPVSFMQGNDWILWVGIRATSCEPTHYAWRSEKEGNVQVTGASAAITWTAGLVWSQCILAKGCKDNVSIKQTFPARPACVCARHPCVLVTCTVYGRSVTDTACCPYYYHPRLLNPGHTAACASTRRSPMTPNKANSLMC